MQRLGREKEAQQVYTSVLKSKPSDIGLVAVASNNILAINRYISVYHILILMLIKLKEV